MAPIVWIVACGLAAWAAAALARPALADWFGEIEKPFWTPPEGLLLRAGAFLYVTMALAAGVVAAQGGPGVVVPLALFGVQLALGLAWCGLFFWLRMPAAAFLEICLLWLAVLVTMAG